jgi:polysaccharide export outer membrane protein
MVGVGDLLRITVWEAGGSTGTTLLGQSGKPGGGGTDVVVRVEADGTVAIPYAERIRASGRTVASLEKAVEASLRGQAVEPRVTILVAEPISSSVSVQGDATKPGFVPLVIPQERVLDVVAAAGGSKYPPYETGVRLTRGSATMDMGLQTVLEQPDVYNVKVAGGDTLLLTHSVRKFIALGAVSKPGDQIFMKGTLSLSDALGLMMGLNPQSSDAKAIFLFRREPVELAQRCGIALGGGEREAVPVVYQLDLKDPGSFFTLSMFPVRPDDLLYVSTAPLAEVGKFMQIVSGATQSVAIPRTLFGGFPSAQ